MTLAEQINNRLGRGPRVRVEMTEADRDVERAFDALTIHGHLDYVAKIVALSVLVGLGRRVA